MSRNAAFAATAAAGLLLDQATKAVVAGSMTLGQSIPVVKGLFSLTYIRNTGIAFGLFNDGRSLLKMAVLSSATLLALAFLLWLLASFSRNDLLGGAAVGLVAGGALGNLVDRLRLGEVVDFIDVYWRTHHWPFFNVADSCITVGVGLLILKEFLPGRREA